MTKTLLGILGSPRKLGNSELLVKELYRSLPEGWQLKLLRLPELDIRPCKGCYQCLFGEMRCPLDDDFPLALDALVKADACVVAAPAYLLGANASLKRFLDRGLSFNAHIDRLWNKPAVGAAIAGIVGMEGSTKLAVDSFIKMILGDHRGSVVLYGALPGEIFLTGEGREAAKHLAKALLEQKHSSETSGPVCQLCGGDTFRFLRNGGLRCMLCSSQGDYEWKEGRLQVRTFAGDHSLFLTYEDVRNHAEWLRGMKEKFMAMRKELKAVTQSYTQEGVWIRPQASKDKE
ncbi:MAG: flavodoxin family protein [Syntrophobacteraceae bacterium]|nr:flavodoxin family protein [Syntrophobacteraceae bacterium]